MRLELMEFLYRVMEELVNAGVPIVFKGALVLNLAIAFFINFTFRIY